MKASSAALDVVVIAVINVKVLNKDDSDDLVSVGGPRRSTAEVPSQLLPPRVSQSVHSRYSAVYYIRPACSAIG